MYQVERHRAHAQLYVNLLKRLPYSSFIVAILKKSKPKKPATKLVPLSARRRHNARRPQTGLEKAVYAMLKAEGISFVREKLIGRCHVDVFIEPRTIIELQGCYWHGCAACTKKLTKEQKEWQNRDGRRHYILRKLGYDVVVIWEHEVRDEPGRVQAMLRGLKPVKS